MNLTIGALLVAVAATLAQAGTALAGEQTTACGRINAFTDPTASTPGSVTIGGRTFVLATTVVFYPRSGVAPPAVGSVHCVTGELGPSGTFLTVTAVGHPFMPPYPRCGTVRSLRPATPASTGAIEMSGVGESLQSLAIRAGVALPPDASQGYRCFVQDLTPTGDLVVIGMARSSTDFTIVPANLPGTATGSATESGPTTTVEDGEAPSIIGRHGNGMVAMPEAFAMFAFVILGGAGAVAMLVRGQRRRVR